MEIRLIKTVIALFVFACSLLPIAVFAEGLHPPKVNPSVETIEVPTKTEDEILADHISRKWAIDYKLTSKYVDLASKHATEGGFPSKLDILAIIEVESNFRPHAQDSVSPSMGLMQINVDAHRVKPKDMKDPEKNIKKGSDILRLYRELVGSDNAAIVAYNAGIGGVLNICSKRKPTCSSTYSKKVHRAKEELTKVLKGESWKQ